MTFLVSDLRDHLFGSGNITNAFGNRIFPETVPQKTYDSDGNEVNPYPCVVINELSCQPQYILAGEVGTHITQVQIDVWTDGTGNRFKANELGELVRNRLSGYKGQFGTGCWGSAENLHNNTIAATPLDGSDKHRRRVSQDYQIIHTADVPTFT